MRGGWTGTAFLFMTVAVWGQQPFPMLPCGTGPMGGGFGGFGGVPHGALLTGNESWYDRPTQSIVFNVTFDKLRLPVDCEIRIQGMVATQRANGYWIVEVPVSRTVAPQWAVPPFQYQGVFYTQITYIGALSDPHRVYKPLVYEIVHVPSDTVVTRYKSVIIDKRNDGGFNPNYNGPVVDSAGSEISISGVNKLEPTHASSLPQPSPQAFNTALTNSFARVAQAVSPPKQFGNSDKACIALSAADPEFLKTDAYLSILVDVAAAYTAWETADRVCKAGGARAALACPIAAAACVRQPVPLSSHFELCSGKIEGNSTTLTLAGVTATNLEIGSGTPLRSQVILGRLDGAVNGTLSELFLRWSDTPLTGCVNATRPRRDLTQSDYGRAPIRAWRSCTGLEVDAAWASSQGWISHDLAMSGEALNATATAANPLFLLDPSHPKNPDRGACAGSGFRPHVENLLELYYSRMQTALDSNWLSQHATAMDALMSRWEVGVWENTSDLLLTLNTSTLDYRQNDRINLRYHTEADWPGAAGNSIVYSPPDPFPCFFPYPNPPLQPVPCPTGLSFFQHPFDLSYTLTTPALNQVLRERNRLLSITPTFSQLGVTPPPGKSANDPWELDGTQLSQLFPAFSTLGTTKLTMQIRPTYPLFTWMPPDPFYYFHNGTQIGQPVPQGRTPLTYQIGQYVIELLGDKPAPDGSLVWFQFLADLYDPDFNLKLSADPAKNLVVPSLSNGYGSVFLMVKSQLAACPVSPFPRKPFFLGCGELLETAMASLVRPLLDRTLLSMLENYPAPQFYDANGKATQPGALLQTDKYQHKQVITFYGNLP